MPRANRVFLPGHVWHITHRCHRRQFLLKFARDRRRWRHWLFEARKRYGLCVLNYIVTSNHIHLLVKDSGESVIARSMQLIAGRTGQEFNQRKQRHGAYWEDRYHATSVDKDDYLARCMVYIDLNMVRAGVVSHPGQWDTCGYREIQHPPQRYRVIDLSALQEVLGVDGPGSVQRAHAQWVEKALKEEMPARDEIWTESLAVGSRSFIEQFKAESRTGVRLREISQRAGHYLLCDMANAYRADFGPEITALKAENRFFWDISV